MAARAVSDLFQAAGANFKAVYDKYQGLNGEDGIIQIVAQEIMQLKSDIDASNKHYDQSIVDSKIQRTKRNIYIFRYNEIRQKLAPAKDLLRDITRKIKLFSEAVLCGDDRERLQVLEPEKVREIDVLFGNARTVLPQMKEYHERLAACLGQFQANLDQIKDHSLRTICQRLDWGGAPLKGLNYVGARVERYVGAFELPALKEEDIRAVQKQVVEDRPAAAPAAAGGMVVKRKKGRK